MSTLGPAAGATAWEATGGAGAGGAVVGTEVGAKGTEEVILGDGGGGSGAGTLNTGGGGGGGVCAIVAG